MDGLRIAAAIAMALAGGLAPASANDGSAKTAGIEGCFRVRDAATGKTAFFRLTPTTADYFEDGALVWQGAPSFDGSRLAIQAPFGKAFYFQPVGRNASRGIDKVGDSQNPRFGTTYLYKRAPCK